ncbi:MAG: lipoyl(octanoyl) transferase LipB [Gaiellaceae bacterium]
MAEGAYLIEPGVVPYREAWELQRSLAAAVSQGAIPETVLLLEHPPVVTLGRRTLPEELRDVPVEIVETDRGGKSTYHGPGQLVCYPILDLKRHGKDVKKYVRDLEESLIRTLSAFGIEGARLEGLTGVWLESPPAASGASLASAGRGDSASSTAPRLERRERRERPAEPGSARREPDAAGGGGPRKIASIGVHVSRWVTTHGYALNVDLDPAPFSDWITACGLENAAFTTMARELGRPVTVDEVRPAAAAALEEVFGLAFEDVPADDGPGLWPQPRHAQLAR